MDKKLSYIYISLTICFWASTAAFGKLILEKLNNLQLLFYVSLFATIWLFIIVLLQKKLNLIKEYKISDYWHFAIMGFVGVFLYYIFLYTGLMYAPAQEAFIVNYTWPIWVVIFSIFILKENFNTKKLIGILLGFIWVYIVATNGNLTNFHITNIKGDLFALTGAIVYGLFSIYGKKYNYDKITSIMFYYLFTFLYISITIIIFSYIPAINFYEFLILIWLGVFCSGFAFVFWFLALKHGDTAKISNIIFLTPFFSLVYIYFLLGEKILFSSIIGLVLIILGIIVQSLNDRFIGKKK